jgi:hypothetical protein
VPRAARPAPLSIRLSPEERADLTSRAERAGLSVGGYFRAAVLDVPLPRVSRRPSADRTELARLLGAVGKIGSNVNQLAYVANTGSWPDSRLIAQAVADVRWMRDTLMLALGVTPPTIDQAGGTTPSPAP